jgi:hypothetical protein
MRKSQRINEGRRLTLELQDPLGLIGRTRKSRHCQGKMETYYSFSADPQTLGQLGMFRVRCGCGALTHYERATGHVTLCWGKGYLERIAHLEKQLRRSAPALMRALKPGAKPDSKMALSLYADWGRSIDQTVLRSLEPATLAVLKLQFARTPSNYRGILRRNR